MKQAFQEIKLLIAIMLLQLAVKVTPRHRQESTLMLYYLSAFLTHVNAMKETKHASKI
jgi:hypothetical protein